MLPYNYSLMTYDMTHDEVAEWLRRWTANPMCSARVGSNPILVEEMYVVHVHRNGYDMSFYHVDP